MGQALYRKHRSRKLGEIVGQEHITKTLSQALKQGRISHAYLLTGPRGVGKTSVARILAHEINGLPYDDDSADIDIIEIDAASNRRIDEIRELREKVYMAPVQAKYKVYIIDEVHMLTREAFNALLKTLEEPPEHVVFILATTDAHKLPETIISRTQRYSFKPADKNNVVALLKDIAKQEKIKISPEALELLAEHGEGSFRDSVSMLDQVSSQAEAIELADVQRQLGLPPAEAINDLLGMLAGGHESAGLMKALDKLYDQGYQPAAIAKQLGQIIRHQLADGEPALGRKRALSILGQLIGVPSSHNPASLLEVILLAAIPVAPTPVVQAEPPAPSSSGKAEAVLTEQTEKAPAQQAAPKAKKPPLANAKRVELSESAWPEVLAALKQKHNTLYSVARMAQPRFEDDKVQLVFAFSFHQKRFNEAGNRQLLLDIIKELTGQDVQLECLVDESISIENQPVEVVADESPGLSAISNIFGGGELLES